MNLAPASAPSSIAVTAPPSARRPGAFEGRGGGPYVDDDEVGRPPTTVPELGPGPYHPPRGVQLAEDVAGDTWSFAAIGDYGSGGKAQVKVASTLLARRPDVVLTLGDNAYTFGLEHEWRKRWDPPDRFGAIREQVPVFPSLGNHDTRVGLSAYFRRFPELDKARYYTFERGDVRFVAVDSNQSLAAGSPQRRWLESTLRDAQHAAFRVLYMHHPLRSSRPGSNERLLGDLGPLLQSQHVDLVLSGHEHHYERTKPLNAYGTIGVTHGGGGKELHEIRIAARRLVGRSRRTPRLPRIRGGQRRADGSRRARGRVDR